MKKEVKMVKEMVVKNDVVKEFVDLGLSVKWANMNEGAKSVCENGKYFAWNEVKVDDEGRLPSESEMRELIEKCNWTWDCFLLPVAQMLLAPVYGYVVRSRVNGNAIFLPAAGLICGDKDYFDGEMGYYLTNTCKDNVGACELLFSNKFRGMYLAGSYKRSVRLVSDK